MSDNMSEKADQLLRNAEAQWLTHPGLAIQRLNETVVFCESNEITYDLAYSAALKDLANFHRVLGNHRDAAEYHAKLARLEESMSLP